MPFSCSLRGVVEQDAFGVYNTEVEARKHCKASDNVDIAFMTLGLIPLEGSKMSPSDRVEIIKRATGLSVNVSISRTFLQIYAASPNRAKKFNPNSFEDWIKLLIDVPITASLEELFLKKAHFKDANNASGPFFKTIELFIDNFITSPLAQPETLEILSNISANLHHKALAAGNNNIEMARHSISCYIQDEELDFALYNNDKLLSKKDIQKLDNPKAKKSFILLALLECNNNVKQRFINEMRDISIIKYKNYLYQHTTIVIKEVEDDIDFLELFCELTDLYPDDIYGRKLIKLLDTTGMIEEEDLSDDNVEQFDNLEFISSKLCKLIYIKNKRDLDIAKEQNDSSTIKRIHDNALAIILTDEISNVTIDYCRECVPDFVLENTLITGILLNGEKSKFLAERVSVERLLTSIDKLDSEELETFNAGIDVIHYYIQEEKDVILAHIRSKLPIVSIAPWLGNLSLSPA